jgi:hypothetical protein
MAPPLVFGFRKSLAFRVQIVHLAVLEVLNATADNPNGASD